MRFPTRLSRQQPLLLLVDCNAPSQLRLSSPRSLQAALLVSGLSFFPSLLEVRVSLPQHLQQEALGPTLSTAR